MTWTPNKLKTRKRALRAERAAYVVLRRAALAAARAERANPESGRLAMIAENALCEAYYARKDYHQQKRVIDNAVVLLGCKWSQRGLEHVQRTNRARVGQ